MNVDTWEDLGGLLEACKDHAMQAWQKEYAPHKRTSDLLGNELRAVKIACNVLPAGNVDILIRIQARQYYGHEVYFWKALRVAGAYQILS